MLRHSAAQLVALLAAVSLTAVAGAVATAGSGGGPVSLAPTAELATDGAVGAPGTTTPSTAGGGVAAPTEGATVPDSSSSAPGTQQSAPPPVEPSTQDPTAPAEAPAPEPGEPPDTGSSDAASPADEADADALADAEDAHADPEAAAPPSEADALEAAGQPLVPVEVLSAPVEVSPENAPLIDVTPEPVAAPALAAGAELARAAPAQDDDEQTDETDGDDGEVIIPVPIDEDGADDGPRDELVRVPVAAPGLPRTGSEAGPLMAVGLSLLLVGLFLRFIVLTVTPSPARA